VISVRADLCICPMYLLATMERGTNTQVRPYWIPVENGMTIHFAPRNANTSRLNRPCISVIMA
jgi:hypothetical protein